MGNLEILTEFEEIREKHMKTYEGDLKILTGVETNYEIRLKKEKL